MERSGSHSNLRGGLSAFPWQMSLVCDMYLRDAARTQLTREEVELLSIFNQPSYLILSELPWYGD